MTKSRSLTALILSGVFAFAGTTGTALAKHGADDGAKHHKKHHTHKHHKHHNDDGPNHT